MSAFTEAKRKAFLAAVAAGDPLGRAADQAGVSRWTVTRWLARGRTVDATAEQRAFAQQLDKLRGTGTIDGTAELGDGEAESLLVNAARRGSVSALTELRRRGREIGEVGAPEGEADDPLPFEYDPFVGMELAAGGEWRRRAEEGMTPQQVEAVLDAHGRYLQELEAAEAA